MLVGHHSIPIYLLVNEHRYYNNCNGDGKETQNYGQHNGCCRDGTNGWRFGGICCSLHEGEEGQEWEQQILPYSR